MCSSTTLTQMHALQVPYLAGYGGYANGGVGRCTKPASVAGSQPTGYTTISPQNDDGLVQALQHTPVKVRVHPSKIKNAMLMQCRLPSSNFRDM